MCLIPNLCAHVLPAAIWIVLVALAAGVVASAGALAARNAVIGVALGALSAPLIVWWTHSAVLYGCG